MKFRLMAEKLARREKKLITREELEEDCKKLSADYMPTIKYLLRHKYLERILRGTFYVYSVKERKLGTSEMSFYKILKEAMKIKGIKKWYFGLESALKLNGMTHETFTTHFIINNAIFRAAPINIMGRKIKFYKLPEKILSTGIIKKGVSYSDPEKTALDMLYLKHISEEGFKELSEKLSKKKLLKYSEQYNKKMQEKAKKI